MTALPKVLVSACLLGAPVRYNGSAKTLDDELLHSWQRAGRIVAACPELLGGLPTPRPAAEIAAGSTGRAVLEGTAKVIATGGDDVTPTYLAGAHAMLNLALRTGCRFALLTDGSPSCGTNFIYDGSFSGRRHAAEGVAAALLREHGVAVFSAGEIAALAAAMNETCPDQLICPSACASPAKS